MSLPWVERCEPCMDEDCEGIAEPEQDGDIRYWACTRCGTEFGYQRVSQPQPGACQLGLPEETRRALSKVPVQGRTFVVIGKRPE